MKSGRPPYKRIHFVSRFEKPRLIEIDKRGRPTMRSEPSSHTPPHFVSQSVEQNALQLDEDGQLAGEDFLSDFSLGSPMELDSFLQLMGAPEQPQPPVPDLQSIPLEKCYTLYPGHANVVCIGIKTNSDSASYGKTQLKKLYYDLDLPMFCHTCGREIAPNDTSWVGDHQPPTNYQYYYNLPRRNFIAKSLSHVYVMETSDKKYQTCWPIHPLLQKDPIRQKLKWGTSHLYLPIKEYRDFHNGYDQRYIYPQCTQCSNIQRDQV